MVEDTREGNVHPGEAHRKDERKLRPLDPESEISRALSTLVEPGAVVELRGLKNRATTSGYFSDHDRLAEEAVKLDKNDFAVYITLNEINPALLARSANRVRQYPPVTTSDSDVLRRRWVPLDFDPIRPAGVSSADEEKKAALLRAGEVREYLREQSWPEPVVADSGNGCHLLYSIDLPNNQASANLVKGVLEALAFKFDDESVKLDTSVHNASRIWKLYGTTARKGDDVPERPYRRSRLLDVSGKVN